MGAKCPAAQLAAASPAGGSPCPAAPARSPARPFALLCACRAGYLLVLLLLGSSSCSLPSSCPLGAPPAAAVSFFSSVQRQLPVVSDFSCSCSGGAGSPAPRGLWFPKCLLWAGLDLPAAAQFLATRLQLDVMGWIFYQSSGVPPGVSSSAPQIRLGPIPLSAQPHGGMQCTQFIGFSAAPDSHEMALPLLLPSTTSASCDSGHVHWLWLLLPEHDGDTARRRASVIALCKPQAPSSSSDWHLHLVARQRTRLAQTTSCFIQFHLPSFEARATLSFAPSALSSPLSGGATTARRTP